MTTTSRREAEPPAPGAPRALLRAAALRCPNCGAPWPARGVIHLDPNCVRCGLALDRGEHDYFLGSYTLNLFVALLGAAAIAIASLVVPAHTVLIAAVGLPAIAALAVWLHPRSRMVWLAMDLQFRPLRAEDLISRPEGGDTQS